MAEKDREERREVRVLADGCFDCAHFGHFNFLRKCKQKGLEFSPNCKLVAGIHPKEEMEKQKGPPVFSDEERKILIAGCKWVDEVVFMPYGHKLETMERTKTDYIIHGDEPTILADGTDSYGEVKKANKYVTVPRTAGISTTDLIDRILYTQNTTDVEGVREKFSNYSPSTKIISLFQGKLRVETEKEKNLKIVYTAGAFDIFHFAHVLYLEQARKQGDYLIVGVFSDSEIEKIKGNRFPIMNVYERVLSVLACRYVDEVVINAPIKITEEFIRDFGIKKVVVGDARPASDDRFAVPKKMGIFEVIHSPRGDVTTKTVVDRIAKNLKIFEERQAKKRAKEEKELQ